jgi:hypothetical protein
LRRRGRRAPAIHVSVAEIARRTGVVPFEQRCRCEQRDRANESKVTRDRHDVVTIVGHLSVHCNTPTRPRMQSAQISASVASSVNG